MMTAALREAVGEPFMGWPGGQSQGGSLTVPAVGTVPRGKGCKYEIVWEGKGW